MQLSNKPGPMGQRTRLECTASLQRYLAQATCWWLSFPQRERFRLVLECLMLCQHGRWPPKHIRLGRDGLLGRRWLSWAHLLAGLASKMNGWQGLTLESYLLDILSLSYATTAKERYRKVGRRIAKRKTAQTAVEVGGWRRAPGTSSIRVVEPPRQARWFSEHRQWGSRPACRSFTNPHHAVKLFYSPTCWGLLIYLQSLRLGFHPYHSGGLNTKRRQVSFNLPSSILTCT